MIYRYHPRMWHYFAPLIVFLIGWGFLNRLGSGADIWFLACGFWFAAACWCIWITLAGIIQAGIDYHVEVSGETWTPPNDQPMGEHVQVITDRDQRVIAWALAIISGRSLRRRDWVGMFKPFTRQEYDRKMDDLKKRNVLKYQNGKTSDNGYAVNGAGGWEYIKALSEGREFVPLPRQDTAQDIT